MANPSQVEAQVRFALSQLPSHNAHYEFEHICRHLTQQFICSNVLPATGPVSARGDQGRDFETFRTYLREELGPYGAFLGSVSEGTIAFICTTQSNNVAAKLSGDIEKVCASGHQVQEIRAFTLEPVAVAIRHRLETEAQESHGVRLQLHDAASIATLLAQPQGFWIAERFLSIPAEIRPDLAPSNGDLSDEYVELRNRWRQKGFPNPTLGDFIDLKTGLREATCEQEIRSDLSFWLGLLRDLLASPDLSIHIAQRARYELVVSTLRGTHSIRSVDDVARAYLGESLSEADPVRLQDASALLLFAYTAVVVGVTSFTPAELEDWNSRLTKRVQDLLSSAMPHGQAALLFTLGHLGTHPTIAQGDIQTPREEARIPEPWELYDEQTDSLNVSMRDDIVFTDAPRTLSAWTQLMDNLDNTPLFPIQGLGDILQLFVPLWSDQPEWRELLDRVDEALGERLGKHALATRAKDRAMKLLRLERRLDALEEFHRARIDWFVGETVRGALLAMLIIAKLYLELRLPQAAKSYALAVAYIAELRRDENLADLIPTGLLTAANADFIAGAWCSATELYELGLLAQQEFIEDGIDSETHPIVGDAVMNLIYANACAETIDSGLAASIGGVISRIGAEQIAECVVSAPKLKDRDFWESFGNKELVARPFTDLGQSRYIRFSALGTDWTLTAKNDVESGRVAERFGAAAQAMLAALAREDLCLLQTQIKVRIEVVQEAHTSADDRIKSLPSNEACEWVVQLTPAANSDRAKTEEFTKELFTMLTIILREVSLLPDAQFWVSLDRAFERGLRHKLSSGRPYDELAAFFAADTEKEIHGSQYDTSWDCSGGSFGGHHELRWQDGPGPTYSPDKANELLEGRYLNLAKSLRITIAMLASSQEFLGTVKELRARGWLDWHILAAVFNIVMNYRFLWRSDKALTEEIAEQMMDSGYHPESASVEPVPIGAFTLEAMDEHRKIAMMSLLNHWELKSQAKTPNIFAIERLLRDRYGYWDEDVPHDNPFPHSTRVANSNALVVIRDVQSEDEA